ncbi:MAG: ferrous iron transporter B [Acholeplasmatales bacterium]|jgi:ferrous iron transport protein B|nr:ferrous iron transporter B [Acholeplasmatales bacterium]
MKICVIGNPNSGKTTLFNALTGLSARTGNWPGVTVSKKSGFYKYNNEKIEIVDLPGIYSLRPYSPEEIVSRDVIMTQDIDVIIDIVDTTQIERSLYLTTQILETSIPTVIALNFNDEIIKKGITVDSQYLEKLLKVKVCPISALRKDGIKELMDNVVLAATLPREPLFTVKDDSINPLINYACDLLIKENNKNALFDALKLIEDDEYEISHHKETYELINEEKRLNYQNINYADYSEIIADKRYEFITNHMDKIIVKNDSLHKESKSLKIDKILTHKWLGLPIFLLIMLAIFHLTFSADFLFLGVFIKGRLDNPIFAADTEGINSIGVILSNLMNMLLDFIGNALASWLSNAPQWVSSLVVDGIWTGIGTVLSFIPPILCLFAFLTVLEDTGYMARGAFILDRAFKGLGLSGKSFMPLLMCFGCAVPGIMNTKTLENRREKRLTIFLAPFFSCGAKLAIWTAFAGAVWASHADLFVFGIYLFGIIAAILSSLFLKFINPKRETSPFIMELPEYRRPSLINVSKALWQRLKDYLIRAATIIAAVIIVIWFLSTFNFRFQMVEINESMLGIISKYLSYIFVPVGFGMGQNGGLFIISTLTGILAKELVPATMDTLAGLSSSGGDFASLIKTMGGIEGIANYASIFAFLAYNLLTFPCVAAISTARAELGKKDFIKAVIFWLSSSYIMAFLLYWGIRFWFVGIIFVAILGGLFTFLALRYKNKTKEVPSYVG